MYGDKMAEVEKGPTLICETAILADVDPQFEIRPCGYRSATTCLLCAPISRTAGGLLCCADASVLM
jgi:hypothetical protein